MKVSDIIKLIEKDGWKLERIRGSHRQYSHSIKKGIVTIPGKMSANLAPRTLNSILKQSGIKK